MSSAIDLDAYFARIGYAGSRRPDLETLRGIHLNHVKSIAFENLNPLLKWPVTLEPEALEQKLVYDRRGGYCFEQNLLLSHALSALGFEVTRLLARVRWMVADEQHTPKTHMLLLVELRGGSYVADVGFGGQTLTGPLRLVANGEQQTPHELFRLLHERGEWSLQAFLQKEWRNLYRFDLTPQQLPDFEVCNWYTSTHPRSHFTTGLTVAIAGDGCRYTLRGNEFAVHRPETPTERRALTSGAEIREMLTSRFALRVPEAPEMDAIFAREAGGPRLVAR
jgi:N-hydroxyarylamine O-acetyltransferase